MILYICTVNLTGPTQIIARMRRSSDRAAPPLAALLQHPALWRAGSQDAPPVAMPSGFPALDEHLPGGGWPQSGLAELLLATAGVGELRLLAPLMAALSRQQPRWLAWVAPPFIPYAPALAAQGVNVDRLLLVQPQSHTRALWALERAARSGSCSLILGWLDERQLRVADTRRLKLAAHQGNALLFLFRPDGAAAHSSLAELRLRLAPAEPDTMTVDVCKRRGGWPMTGIQVSFARPSDAARPLDAEAPQDQLARWRQWQRRRHAAALRADFPRDQERGGARSGPPTAPSGLVH